MIRFIAADSPMTEVEEDRAVEAPTLPSRRVLAAAPPVVTTPQADDEDGTGGGESRWVLLVAVAVVALLFETEEVEEDGARGFELERVRSTAAPA